MTPPTPLPEQGGFNERLGEILQVMFNSTRPDVALPKAKAAIRTLILEKIIGEDEPLAEDASSIDNVEDWAMSGNMSVDDRNQLRVEQRQRLGGTHGTK